MTSTMSEETALLGLSRYTTLRDAQDNLFGRAIDDFLAELKDKDKDEKNPFLKEILNQNEPTSRNGLADHYAQELQDSIVRLEAQKHDRVYRLVQRLGPFLQGLKGLLRTCETLFQATPFGVSAAFSGARIVLDLAIAFHEYFDIVVDAMEKIGDNLIAYQKYAEAFETSPEFQDRLVRSYKRIIKFWYSVSRNLSRRKLAFKSIAVALIEDTRDALAGLKDDALHIQSLAVATESLQTKRAIEADLRRCIQGWISGGNQHVDVRDNLRDQLQRRQDGTCTWIFEDQRFLDWRDDTQNNSVLWYNAAPGTGKSVMASAVIDHLSSRGAQVAWYFFSFSNTRRRNGMSGLRSLALQLLTILDSIPDALVDTYQDEMKRNAINLDSPAIAAVAIHRLMTQCHHVYIVVDGIDECTDEKDLLFVLQTLLSQNTYGLVKWLFTSRNYSEIRQTMEKVKAVEITPDEDAILKDIQAYFSANLTLSGSQLKYTEGEDNFLYARFVCETLRGQGLTCDAEIEEALEKFPKDLTTYYTRALEKIAERSEEEQELARRVFLLLVGTLQSITLEEAVDALSIRLGAMDHDKSRVPRAQLIQDLCGPLLVMDDSGTPGNPVLRLYHKTVEDFFLESPEKLQVGPHLRKYFTTYRRTSREIGLLCLTYMAYDRYTKHRSISKLVDQPPPEHAFLRYAAVFWFQHLLQAKPTDQVQQATQRLLESKAFWTCLGVQSRMAPHLFGRYAGLRRKGSYSMGIGGADWFLNDYFGVPLPQWLDSPEFPELSLLDRSFCSFVEDWREVLVTNPDGLDACAPLRKFERECHLTPLSKVRLKVAHFTEPMDSIIFDFHVTPGKPLWANILYRDRADPDNQIKRLQIPLFSDKRPVSTSHFLPTKPEVGERFRMVDSSIESWSLDQQSMTIRRTGSDSESFEIPTSLHRSFRKEKWKLILNLSACSTRLVSICHVAWMIASGRDLESEDDEVEEDEGSDSDNASESNESDNLSNDDSEDESESNDDSDAGSEDDLLEDAGEDRPPDQGIMLQMPGCAPYWIDPWTTQATKWANTQIASHPTLPIVAISHTVLKLEIVDMEKRTQRTLSLPEISDLGEIPAASSRELRFSSCGNYLHLLLVSYTIDSCITKCHVKLSTFSFNENSDDSLVRGFRARSCTYDIYESLHKLPIPMALTCWGDDAVIVALPPLTCNPKILKITLPKELESGTNQDDAISTLREPIYFPTSTPCRTPQLLYRAGGDNYIYLALGPMQVASDTEGTRSHQSKPPVVLRWKIASSDGWRLWDSERDKASVDPDKRLSVAERLRGSFVDGNKSFSVAIRGGLNWSRKGYLSCA